VTDPCLQVVSTTTHRASYLGRVGVRPMVSRPGGAACTAGKTTAAWRWSWWARNGLLPSSRDPP